MKKLFLGLIALSTVITVNSVFAQAGNLLDEIMTNDIVMLESISDKNQVECRFRAQRGDFWSNGNNYTDLNIHFESTDREASASSTVAGIPSINDELLFGLLSSNEGLNYLDQDGILTTVKVIGKKRIIEIKPQDPAKYYREMNSDFVATIVLVDGKVSEISKKHWQKSSGLWSKKVLTFDDTCKFEQ